MVARVSRYQPRTRDHPLRRRADTGQAPSVALAVFWCLYVLSMVALAATMAAAW